MTTARIRFALLAVAACAATGCRSVPGPAGDVHADDITVRTVEYRDGDTVLVGRLAVPARPAGLVGRPAVLVVHEWWGRTPHADRSAEELARMGYVGLALDMYGGGRTTTDAEQAGAWAKAVRGDPAVERRRFAAALALVRSLPEVDPAQVASIGFCFGGTVSLNAAWAGEDLRAVVSFHGSLTTPTTEQVPGVKAAVLVCHGADDPFVPAASVTGFHDAMRASGLDWTFTSYGGAVHSFTNPAADGSFNPGAKYHAVAAARSWADMRSFLAQTLGAVPAVPPGE